jgi:hypothetical protein
VTGTRARCTSGHDAMVNAAVRQSLMRRPHRASPSTTYPARSCQSLTGSARAGPAPYQSTYPAGPPGVERSDPRGQTCLHFRHVTEGGLLSINCSMRCGPGSPHAGHLPRYISCALTRPRWDWFPTPIVRGIVSARWEWHPARYGRGLTLATSGPPILGRRTVCSIDTGHHVAVRRGRPPSSPLAMGRRCRRSLLRG